MGADSHSAGLWRSSACHSKWSVLVAGDPLTEAQRRAQLLRPGRRSDPIPNLGTHTVSGTADNGQSLTVGFDVAKITRPLASVGEIVKKSCQVVFDSDGSYIQNKKTGKTIPVRQDGNLYYPDLWVQVPDELSASPFVRQAS